MSDELTLRSLEEEGEQLFVPKMIALIKLKSGDRIYLPYKTMETLSDSLRHVRTDVNEKGLRVIEIHSMDPCPTVLDADSIEYILPLTHSQYRRVLTEQI